MKNKKRLFGAIAALAAAFSFTFAAVYAWFYKDIEYNLPLEPDPFEVVINCAYDTDAAFPADLDQNGMNIFRNFMPGNTIFITIDIISYPYYADALTLCIWDILGADISGIDYSLTVLSGYDGRETGKISDLLFYTVTALTGDWDFASPPQLPTSLSIGPTMQTAGGKGYIDVITLAVPQPVPVEGLGIEFEIIYAPSGTVDMDINDTNELLNAVIVNDDPADAGLAFRYKALMMKVTQIQTA